MLGLRRRSTSAPTQRNIAEAVQRCAGWFCGAEPFQKLLCLMADYADCRTEILMITAIRNTLVHRVSLMHAMG